MRDLEAELNALCDEQPFKTGWYLKELTTNQEIHRFGYDVFYSASTRKTSIMMAALSYAHQGRLDLDEEVILEERLKNDVVSGTLQHMTTGLRFPLRDALVNMIITSDNVSTQILLERISLEQMNEYCRSIGMKETVHRFKFPPTSLPYDHDLSSVTVTTPADQGLLLDLILKGADGDESAAKRLGCSTELCRYAIDVLSWQKLTKILPSLLPKGTKVAHKTGTGKRGRMDAGIVFRNGRALFILSYFTDNVPPEMPDGLPGHAIAERLGGALARLCWDRVDG